MTWAVNVLAPFLLTSLAMNAVKGRIVNVSSISAGRALDWGNLNQVGLCKQLWGLWCCSWLVSGALELCVGKQRQFRPLAAPRVPGVTAWAACYTPRCVFHARVIASLQTRA